MGHFKDGSSIQSWFWAAIFDLKKSWKCSRMWLHWSISGRKLDSIWRLVTYLCVTKNEWNENAAHEFLMEKLFGAGYILNQVLNLLISTWYMTAAALKTQIIWFGTFERFYSHLTNMRILNKFHFYFQMYCLSRIVFSNLPKISRIKLEWLKLFCNSHNRTFYKK